MTCLRKNRVPDRLTLVVNCSHIVSLTYCAIFDETIQCHQQPLRYSVTIRDTHAHINENHNENDNYDGKAAYTHTHNNRATSQTHALIESMHPYAV